MNDERFESGEIVGVSFPDDVQDGFDVILVKVPSRVWSARPVHIEWRIAEVPE